MGAASPAVTATALTRTFPAPGGGTVQAVAGVSFTVGSGELTALVGPDGAGKTTLLRMIAGLLEPDAGTLTVLGRDVVADPQAVQDRISYMPQRFGLYEDLSVQENLELYADLHGVPREVRTARFARLLAMTDLAAFTGRPAGKLSGGMKQKLGLACTLVRSPDLLLLDEPSAGVDPLSRRELWRIVEQLLKDPGDTDAPGGPLSVLFSTTYMDEAQRGAQVFVMNRGQLLTSGAPAALTAQVEGLTYAAVPKAGSPPRELQAHLVDASDAIVDAVPRGGKVHFIRHPEVDARRLDALLNGVPYRSRPGDLEDAVMLLLKEHQGQAAAPASPPAPAILPRRAAPGPRDDKEIVVRNLVRRFGDFTAVAGVSFEVARGEIFGLLGPNGAGKTTTFRMLCGLLPASGGQLTVAGVNLRTAAARARRRIGYVSQKFALYGNLTVRENLELFGGASGLSGRQLRGRIAATLAQFDLPPQARAGDLPGGYKQRLAMGTGLLHEPDILFLDEPTSGIDPLARRAFWRTITGLSQAGVTIIITTHFMEEAEYCDRIAIQDGGHLLALGTPAEVRAQAGGVATADMDSAFIAIVRRARATTSATPGAT